MLRFDGKKQWFLIPVLLVVFSLLNPGPLSAKRGKRGSWVTVIQKDGQSFHGELLQVKANLIVVMANSATGTHIPIGEIVRVEERKKGKFWHGALVGVGLSMVAGGIIGNKLRSEGMNFIGGAIIYGGIFAIPTSLVFGGISALSGKTKRYELTASDRSKVLENLGKLKSKARFR